MGRSSALARSSALGRSSAFILHPVKLLLALSAIGIIASVILLAPRRPVILPSQEVQCRCRPTICVCIEGFCYDKIAPIRDGPTWSAWSASKAKTHNTSVEDFMRGQQIGRGGFGEVWIAKMNCDEANDERFVLKEVWDEEEWKKEVRFGLQLRDEPYISRYIASGHTQGKSVIVFRFEGISLYKSLYSTSDDDGIVTATPLQNNMRMSIITQLLKALQVLHRHKIVHRDIKPENIVLSTAGELRLIDFGSAVDSGSKMLFHSSQEETEDYIPPQAWKELRASSEFTPAFDTWSTGVVFLEIFGAKGCRELTTKQYLLLQRNRLVTFESKTSLARLQGLMNICVDFRLAPPGALGVMEGLRGAKLEEVCGETPMKRFETCAAESFASNVYSAISGMLRFHDAARLTPQEALNTVGV